MTWIVNLRARCAETISANVLKFNLTHTSDIVVKRPRKASVGIQSHGIFPLSRENTVVDNLIAPY